MSRELRLGLVGLGRWGRVLAANVADLPGVTLAAIATGKTEAPVPRCLLRPHWRDLLELGLDGLLIASPPASHAAIARAALARGMALFVEKPLTLDAAEAAALAEAAEDADGLVMVDHIHLFSPAFRTLKALAGPIRRMEGRAGNHGPYRQDAGVLWDWGPHDVAMMIDLMDTAPDQAKAEMVERRAMGDGIGETIRLDLGFGAAEGSATLSTLTDKCRSLTVECADGTLLVYDDVGPVRLSRRPPGGEAEPVECGPERPLQVALGEFAQAIRTGSRERSGLRLGRQVVEVLGRCQSSLGGAP
ncbi:Gfo/Idh/MocA family oxidoreductase [Magnetospirillum sp. 15-1]|uniref:Gfo/Idh/MocA family oxidoreductase n=1 Tax=Magnetospirillum sp. 15-1 TaxID=1979370 RepID=UPI000BBB742E|nr:Gfo/Idh/MocA family oxidoreductase [Magnetospirillum sp. 15-1]